VKGQENVPIEGHDERQSVEIQSTFPDRAVVEARGKMLTKLVVEAMNICATKLCSVPFTFAGKTQPWVVEVAVTGTVKTAEATDGSKIRIPKTSVSSFFMDLL
jgi:hypothetical protein